MLRYYKISCIIFTWRKEFVYEAHNFIYCFNSDSFNGNDNLLLLFVNAGWIDYRTELPDGLSNRVYKNKVLYDNIVS